MASGPLVGAAAVVDRAVGRRRGARRRVGHRIEQPDPLEGDAEHGGAGALEPGAHAHRRRLGEGRHVAVQDGRHDPFRPAPLRGRRRTALERLVHLLWIHLALSLPAVPVTPAAVRPAP